MVQTQCPNILHRAQRLKNASGLNIYTPSHDPQTPADRTNPWVFFGSTISPTIFYLRDLLCQLQQVVSTGFYTHARLWYFFRVWKLSSWIDYGRIVNEGPPLGLWIIFHKMSLLLSPRPRLRIVFFWSVEVISTIVLTTITKKRLTV